MVQRHDSASHDTAWPVTQQHQTNISESGPSGERWSGNIALYKGWGSWGLTEGTGRVGCEDKAAALCTVRIN